MTTTKEVFGDANTLNRPDKSAETDNKSTSSDEHENLVLIGGGTNENCEHNFAAPRSTTECQVLVEEAKNTTAVANDGQHRYADIYAVSSCGTEGTMKLRLTKLNERNYYVSPINSDESDVDDTDLDKNFNVSESSGNVSDSAEGLGAGSPDVLASPKKGKKRKTTPDNWITKRAKNLRNSGKAYLSTSKSKKQVSARKVRPPCGEKCRLNCSLKIDQDVREVLFHNFWKLGNLQQQREFIVRNTETIKPKYRYSSTQDFRQLNSAFYFEIDNNRIRVCKKFFKATLDINDRPIWTALSKKNDTGFVDGDKRGKQGKQPTVNPEIKESVRKLINSIPRIESHYLRAQSKCEYIEGGKSLADIYRDYKEQRELQELPFGNSVMFNRIFNGEFNISFYIPKKDQCDLCETYKNADDEEKEKLVNVYYLHQEEELCRKEKDLDKNNQDGLCVVYWGTKKST